MYLDSYLSHESGCWPPGILGKTVLTDLPILFVSEALRIHSQYHQFRLVANQGILLLHQLEPLLHQLGIILLTHTCQKRNLVSFQVTPCNPYKPKLQKQQWGKMCKESRARCCQSTPKPGPLSLPRAHRRVEVTSKRILFSLEPDFFFLSDFLVIACFFLTLTAESPDFCISLSLSLEELYRSSYQLLKCILIKKTDSITAPCVWPLFSSIAHP